MKRPEQVESPFMKKQYDLKDVIEAFGAVTRAEVKRERLGEQMETRIVARKVTTFLSTLQSIGERNERDIK